MKKIYISIVVYSLTALMLAGCSAQAVGGTPVNQVSGPTASTNAPRVAPATATLLPTATDTEAPPTQTQTPTASPTATIQPSATIQPLPTFPLELTQTPGILATVTAFAAAKTAEYQTDTPLMGSMVDLLQIGQYYQPVGTPVASWHDLPVMPQAVAGQEFRSDIYSYTAAATLEQASKYYQEQSASLKWTCFPATTGSAGSGTNEVHQIYLICQGFVVSLVSFNNNPAQVIVILNKAP